MSNANTPTKLGIIGAGGVGSATAYAATLRGTANEIVLYDIDGKRAEAEALDIAHGTMFASEANVVGGDDIELLRDCDMIIITAGARQEPGQPRLALAGANVRILEKLLPNLMSVSPNAIYMLVTNPCDVLTVVAQKITGLPSNRVLSSGTVLDSSRLRWLIARKAGVSMKSVHANVVGEHGDSEFPVWSAANIGMVPLTEWEQDGKLLFTEQVRAELAHEAMRAAYKVIEGKGSTNYAIGVSASRIAEAFLQGQNAVLPVSTIMDGSLYGLKDVALSLPTIVNRSGISRVLEVPMNEAELAQLHASAEAIRASLNSLGF
ncbi:MAG: L-lactate dehydrogenase [Rothia sp. (in: high G+C Gram-positive bacteria)]|uniref:L-lactate dehydrogenase n=1 Tax=Rothia sp. (in: high G+C Gram-positive bacteria) TaxID=1885016 RepID=UPI0026E0684B|nr:L-lactate dehydrogenase [Rothia sp. (in: high G+C Gram-positive bacteria)]MDO5750588.1 L-lactate dehydrogenase [Rothia sp. (in: high G+C Gram-positive bacteria)]